MVEDAISGAEIAPCLPTLAVARLTLCLLQDYGLVCSWLAFLWYSLNLLFCEWASLCPRLELFEGKLSLSLSLSLSLFFPLSLAVLQFGLLSHVSSLRLSSELSGSVHTLSMQPTPPCLAPACWWWRQASRLLLCWELQLGAYSVGFFFFFPPSYAAL